MLFKELFDKEFLYESSKVDKNITKIFYKFDINIKKIEEVKEPEAPAATPEQNPAPAPQPEATPEVGQTDAVPAPAPQPEAEQIDTSNIPNLATLAPSVVTEDDNENIEINDDNNIIRKLEGEISLTKEQIDNIQTVEDLIQKLTEEKQDGVNVLDEFTSDILITIADPSTQMQLKDKIDKESSIFAEVLYGKKRENSIGLRIIKRKNSDLLTTSMIIDNKIINAQYKKDTLDKRITDYRNDEYEEK